MTSGWFDDDRPVDVDDEQLPDRAADEVDRPRTEERLLEDRPPHWAEPAR